MGCTNFAGDITGIRSGSSQHRPDIETASKVIGINLNESINLSEMQVKEATVTPVQLPDGRLFFERKSELNTFIPTDDGESEEELEIIIIRRSQKRPML